jgi:hypothetical protein
MDDEYFVNRPSPAQPPSGPVDPDALDVAPLLGGDRARLEHRVRIAWTVVNVMGAAAALAVVVLMVLGLLGVLRFFESLPF